MNGRAIVVVVVVVGDVHIPGRHLFVLINSVASKWWFSSAHIVRAALC